MTSWIRAQGQKGGAAAAAAAEKSFYLQTTSDPLSSQYLNFFYSYLYAKHNNYKLHVTDTNNLVGTNFSIFQSTLKDISGVVYTDSRKINSTSLNGREGQIRLHVDRVPLEDLKQAAADFFIYNDTFLQTLRAYLQGLSLLEYKKGAGIVHKSIGQVTFDVGIAEDPVDKRGSGGSGNSVQKYLYALKDIAVKRGRSGSDGTGGSSSLAIFVMAQDPNFINELQKGADPSWAFYTFQGGSAAAAQAQGLRPNQKQRQDAFYQFMTELTILLASPATITNLSTPLGKLIYLNAASQKTGNFKSIDVPNFSA